MLDKYYEEFLDSHYNIGYLICDSCGYLYSHPLNYCVKCPGKIVRAKLTVFQMTEKYREKHGYITAFEREFADWLRENKNIEGPYNYNELAHIGYDVLRARRQSNVPS